MNAPELSKVTAQVAVEAIANAPEGYDAATVEAVRRDGKRYGVAALYLDMLPAAWHGCLEHDANHCDRCRVCSCYDDPRGRP